MGWHVPQCPIAGDATVAYDHDMDLTGYYNIFVVEWYLEKLNVSDNIFKNRSINSTMYKMQYPVCKI